MDWSPVFISLRVGFWATAIGVALGTALGYLISRQKNRWKTWFEAFVLLPLVLPPTVLGYYLLVVIGRRGPVGEAWEWLFGSPIVFTQTAAIIAACVSTVPLVARFMAAAFTETSRSVIEAARIDGAGGWPLFFRIQLPQVRASLAAASTVAFARSVGDFGTTLMVAGNLPGRTQTAAIAIYDRLNAGRDSEALALAVMVSVISLAVLVAASVRRIP